LVTIVNGKEIKIGKKSFGKNKMSLNMAVENLLNKEYTEPLSFQRTQPGRNYRLFLTMHF